MAQRVCPVHLEPLDDELRCYLEIQPRRSWLVTDDQGRVLAAGREAGPRRVLTRCCWLAPGFPEPRAMLAQAIEAQREQVEELPLGLL